MSETDYLNQIQQLVDLQKVDDEIFAVNQKIENAPLKLRELKQRFDSVEQRRNHILDKLSHLQEQKKRLSFEIDDDSAKIKKSKNKMMQVENQREYQAVLREMDNMEKSNRSREEERITLLEELNLQNDNLAEIDAEYSEIKAELEEKEASLEATLTEARDRLSVLDKQRQQFSAGIPLPIFQRYEFIRNRLEHPVIVPVQSGICAGCHIAIPPQAYIELQRGQQILSCPNCQRLIFWTEEQDADGPSHAERRAKRSRQSRHEAEDLEAEIDIDEEDNESDYDE